MRKTIWALGALLGLGLLLPVGAVAQGGKEAISGGAATANEAAEGLLKAWKAKDKEAFRQFVKEDDRAEAVMLLDCSTIEEYKLGEVKATKEGKDAHYTWTVMLDPVKFADILIASARAEGKKSGASPQEIEQQVAMLKGMLPGLMPMFKSHFEKSTHTMRLVELGGRWFVDEPIEDPTPPGGGGK